MNALLFVLRTGCQWNALNATGICSCSSAYRRFREWTDAGVFEAFWRTGLAEYDGLTGIDWSWLSMDGAMSKARRCRAQKNRGESDGSWQAGRQAQPADRSGGDSLGLEHRWRQPSRHEAGRKHIGNEMNASQPVRAMRNG
jgi:transposase